MWSIRQIDLSETTATLRSRSSVDFKNRSMDGRIDHLKGILVAVVAIRWIYYSEQYILSCGNPGCHQNLLPLSGLFRSCDFWPLTSFGTLENERGRRSSTMSWGKKCNCLSLRSFWHVVVYFRHRVQGQPASQWQQKLHGSLWLNGGKRELQRRRGGALVLTSEVCGKRETDSLMDAED